VNWLDAVRSHLALLVGAAWLASAPASAQPSHTISEKSTARTDVVFATIGIGARPVHGSLAELLTVELRRMGLSLVEQQPSEPLSAWASGATRSRRVLAAILLDGRSGTGWRLIVIDAARGRAIARALPGGIRDDAASIEAVVSIVVSATSALREGLEVASAPLANVVEESHARSATPATTSTAHAPPPGGALPPHQSWALRGVVGGSVASFSPAAPTTEGLGLSLGVTFRARVEARAFGAAYLPPLISSPFGQFRVARALLGAAAGPVFRAPAFSFAPEVGFVAERLRRYDAVPTAEVFATPPSALYRFGGLLALRLRHTLLRPLSLELVTGAIYFGRRVEFTARSPENSWTEGVWPTVAFAQLGLEIATN
jgi:hypothetical protein